MIYSIGPLAFDHIYTVAKLPQINTSSYIKREQTFFGGAAGNFAYQTASLGEKCAVVSVVGGDFKDSDYEQHLKQTGADLKYVKIFPNERTSHAHIFSDENGELLLFFNPAVSNHFQKICPPKLSLKKGDLIHLAMGDPKFNVKISEYCAENNFKGLSFDPGYDIPHYSKKELEAILRNTRFLFCNRDEMEQIRRKVNKLPNAFGVEYCIVTKGHRGSVIFSRNKRIDIATFPTKVIDTTGAGDAYRAGFLTAFLRGMEIHDCGKIGSSLASFVCEKHGAQTNAPSWEKVLERTEV